MKILEALAYGVPVVATRIAAAGLDVAHERDIVLDDDPVALARWIDRLLDDDDLCQELAENGRRTVERLYDWRTLGKRLDTVVRTVVDRAG